MDDITAQTKVAMGMFETLHTHTHDVMTELSALKDSYRKQSENFCEEIARVKADMIHHVELLNKRCNKHDKKLERHQL
jgi:hypothetical protein